MLSLRHQISKRVIENGRIFSSRHMSLLNSQPEKKQEIVKKNECDKDEEDCYEDEFKVFKLKQLEFQKDDNIPIFLKCGLRDKILYYLTLILAGFGLTNTIGFIYLMAQPKKNKNEK